MRRLRRTKIVATLGPSSSERSVIAALFRAGADVFRINMSHTSHERMRELVATIRSIEERMRPADRHPGRSAGPEAARRAVRRRPGGAAEGRHLHARCRSRRRADATRVHLPHPEIFAAIEPGHALLLDDGKVRLTATEVAERQDRHARRSRRQPVGPQGREPARHHDSVLGAGAEGPLRSRSRARRRRRLGRALLHPAAGRHRRSQEDHPRPRRGDGQDREAAGGDTGSTRSSTSPTR